MVPKRKVGRAPRRTFSRALRGKAVMARTTPHHRTVEQQAAWETQQAADAREAAQEAAEAAARRTRRGLRASRDEVDEELILPVPNTELEEPGNHLTGRRRKTTLVLVLLLATLAMGSRGALWRRERLLWEEYCGKMLRSEFTRMYRMDPCYRITASCCYWIETHDAARARGCWRSSHDGQPTVLYCVPTNPGPRSFRARPVS